jgi:hypothetical protein
MADAPFPPPTLDDDALPSTPPAGATSLPDAQREVAFRAKNERTS